MAKGQTYQKSSREVQKYSANGHWPKLVQYRISNMLICFVTGASSQHNSIQMQLGQSHWVTDKMTMKNNPKIVYWCWCDIKHIFWTRIPNQMHTCINWCWNLVTAPSICTKCWFNVSSGGIWWNHENLRYWWRLINRSEAIEPGEPTSTGKPDLTYSRNVQRYAVWLYHVWVFICLCLNVSWQ